MAQQRARRPVSPWALALLQPIVRYSYSREAYILRGIGRYYGPVLVPRAGERPSRHTVGETPDRYGRYRRGEHQ